MIPPVPKQLQNVHNIILLILIFFTLGLMGKWYYLFDVLNHFRPFLAFAMGIACGWIAWIQYTRRIWIYIFLASMLNLQVYLYTPELNPDKETHLDLMHINLLVNNPNHQPIIQLIKSQQPHIISLQETTPRWEKILRTSLPNYDFFCHVLDSPFGICVASTIPWTQESVFFVQDRDLPAISLTSTINSRQINFVFVHPNLNVPVSIMK